MDSVLTIVVICILVGGTFASFKYPAKLYLYAKASSDTVGRLVFTSSIIVAIFWGTFAMGGISLCAMILLGMQTSFILKFAVYFLAFVVEVIGNLIHIKRVYGGVKELLEEGKSYEVDEDYLDDEEEDYYDDDDGELPYYGRNDTVVKLQEYKDGLGKR